MAQGVLGLEHPDSCLSVAGTVLHRQMIRLLVKQCPGRDQEWRQRRAREKKIPETPKDDEISLPLCTSMGVKLPGNLKPGCCLCHVLSVTWG